MGPLTITHYFLLLTIFSLSTAQSTRNGIKWLLPNHSALIHLPTPDLPLWNPTLHLGQDLPTALLLNFTLARDNRTLLLNNLPIFPFPNVPPRLSAPQTAVSLAEFLGGELPDYGALSVFELDYYREEKREREGGRGDVYLTVDILGAGIAGYNALLRDETQKYVILTIQERSPCPYPKSMSERTYTIKDITLLTRFPDLAFTSPNMLKKCSMWSWRCGDVDQYPWYRYVYRQAFDGCGRRGSARHEVCRRWETLRERLGTWRLVGVLGVVGSMVVSPLVYGVYRCVNTIRVRQEKEKGRYEEEEELLRDYEGSSEEQKMEVGEKQEGKPVLLLPVESAKV